MVSPEALVVIGFAIIFVTVGIGLLVSSWPRPDTRPVSDATLKKMLENEPHRSVTSMVREVAPRRYGEVAPRRYGEVVDEREPPMRDEGDAL